MKELEDFLRENKPRVDVDPTFLMETRRRLEQVEGIKGEVDRQRRHGRRTLVAALVAGIAVGVLATAVAFLYPVDAGAVGEGIWQSVRLFLREYRQYLVILVAALSLGLGVVLSRRGALEG